MRILALLSCLFIIAAAADKPAHEAPDFTGWDLYRVTRIVDGDTIVVELDGDEYKVRIIGVDTPETKHPNKPVEEFGQEASDFTTELLEDAAVYLEPDQGETLAKDRYGRLLAHVWREDGLLVAYEIISQGYGYYYSKYPFRGEYMDLLKTAEVHARHGGIGLWHEEPEPIAEPDPTAELKPKILTNTTVLYDPTGLGLMDKSNQDDWIIWPCGMKWDDFDTSLFMGPATDEVEVPFGPEFEYDEMWMTTLMMSDPRAPVASISVFRLGEYVVAMEAMMLLDSTQPGVPEEWATEFLTLCLSTFGMPQEHQGEIEDWSFACSWDQEQDLPDVVLEFSLEGCVLTMIDDEY